MNKKTSLDKKTEEMKQRDSGRTLGGCGQKKGVCGVKQIVATEEDGRQIR